MKQKNILDAESKSVRQTQIIINENLDFSHDNMESELLAALLFDGLQMFLAVDQQALTKAEQIKTTGAKDWVLSREHDYPYSFENVCSSLGIVADNLRLGLINVRNTLN